MKCPNCGKDQDNVVDSRPVNDGLGVRRRRKCCLCQCSWTTYEYEQQEIALILYKEHKKKVDALVKMILEFQSMFSDIKE
jgi:transcriptional repressor NrdR